MPLEQPQPSLRAHKKQQMQYKRLLLEYTEISTPSTQIGPLKLWFYRILVNECNRVMKDKSRVVFVSHYMEQDSIHARKDDYHFEEYEELYAAIEALSDIYRIPIILKISKRLY